MTVRTTDSLQQQTEQYISIAMKTTKIIGQIDTLQLPGQAWTIFSTMRTWSWGGIDEKNADGDDLAAACSPTDVRWKTVVKIISEVPFERGYIGSVHIFRGQIWWNGWKSLEQAAQEPDAVLSIVKGIFEGAKTVTAVVLEAQLSLAEQVEA